MRKTLGYRFGGITRMILLAFIILNSLTVGDEVAPADLALINGKIITMDEDQPEVQALAIRGDVIVAVGSTDEIRAYIRPNTRIMDLRGLPAIPGFIDSHVHFLSVGYARMRLDLKKAKNWLEIVELVKEEVGRRKPGEWITGRGWHQDKWETAPQPNINGLPFNEELNRVSPDNPVVLTHASGHSCIANANAMARAKIDADTPDPEGGKIIKDDSGRPIGVFLETAMTILNEARIEYLSRRPQEEIDEERRLAIQLATQECLSKGVTGVHDAGQTFEIIDLYKKLAEEDQLGIRLYVMVAEENDSLAERLDDYKIIGAGNNFLTVRSVKRLIDGALGSHGAWLLEPYADDPQSTGLNTEAIDTLIDAARIAAGHGFQLCTHAIGDRGNREILDIYQAIFEDTPEVADRRWRVEHVQHLHPDDITRFGKLEVIASMQSVHCTSDGPWVPSRIGDRRAEEGAYVWRKLMQTGAVICNGTDAPVEDIDPLDNFYAAVTRRLPDGSQFYPEQCMSREEALQSYTINAAYAAFEEEIKGSLTPGKLADITILSHDIMTVPAEKIPEVRVLYTILGGKVVHRPEKR